MIPKDNKISSLRASFLDELTAHQYEAKERDSLFQISLEHHTGLQRIHWLAEPDRRLSESEMMRMLATLEELKQRRPIQYILGQAGFMGMELICDERALIPRPETEELVDWVLGEAQPGDKIIDIGTGTGAIALALSFISNAELHAMESEQAALQLAQENGRRLGASVTWHHDDLFFPEDEYPLFDIIVSNPPYIEDYEREDMDDRVKVQEPSVALFVPDGDPLRFAKGVLQFAGKYLRLGGSIYLEGHKDHGEKAEQLFQQAGYTHVERRPDLDGHDRFLKAVKAVNSPTP